MMAKVKSLEELRQFRKSLYEMYRIREMADRPESLVQIRVAMATCGIASGAKEVKDFFVEELEKRGIDAMVAQTGCMGYCYAEPTIEVTLPGCQPVVFGYVNTKRADEIIERYIKNGELVDDLIPVTYLTIKNNE